MSKKYIAKLDGEIVGKRTTASRTYTHAIVVKGDNKPGVVTWCGRPDLAQKEASVWRKRFPFVWIVDAIEVTK